MPDRRRARVPRRAWAVLPLLAVLAALAGCAALTPAPGGWTPVWARADEATDDGRVRVVATFTVLADVVAQVGGPDVAVTSVTGPGMNVHGYEPTPDDLRRLAGADLVVANGLGLETWLEDLVRPLGVPLVVVTDGVEPLPLRGSDAATGGLVHNPHAWMSPREGRRYVEAVAAALTQVDPAGAAGYLARAEAYAARLTALEREVRERLAVLPPERRLLVTCEGAFSYLARDLGLEEAFLWPVNAERQGTPRQVAAVVDRVRESGVPAVFCEWTVAPTAQRQVARETGARYAGELYVDSLTGPDGPAPTYLDLLRYDADLVADALGAAT